MNILLISPDFNYACGVSKHVYLILKELNLQPHLRLFFITNNGDSLERLKGINVEIKFMNLRRGNRNPILFIYNIILLSKFCIKNQIDIIHTHHRYPELLAYIVSVILGIKTVTTVHSFVSKMNLISFRSDKIITVSKSVQRYLLQNFNVRKESTIQLYNFIAKIFVPTDFEMKQCRNELRIVKNEKIIFFAGRIGNDKGSDILITAFNQLVQKYSNIKLLLIGKFETTGLRNSIKDNCKVLYIESIKDIIPYLLLAEIVVLPSRVDPFPYLMLEAGIASKPFIGAKTGGIQEFIEDGINGLLVQPGNVNDLIEKISLLMDNYNISVELGKKLNEKVSKLISSEEYCLALLKIYSDLKNDLSK